MKSLKEKQLFLLDLDGTVYLDGHLMPHALDFLTWITTHHRHYAFMTNNSSRSTLDYVKKLQGIGISASANHVITSTQIAISYIKKTFPNQAIFVVGTTSMVNELIKEGIAVRTTCDPTVVAVLVGYDSELTYQKLYDASQLLTQGKAFIATNPDWVCPVSFGYVPDCGSFCQMLEHATKRKPLFLGKPAPDIVSEASQRFNVKLSDIVVIGDRLYTDILCGVNANVDTVLVLSGESTRDDVIHSAFKPTYILDHIGILWEQLTQS